jgi:copper chaperone
MGTYRLSAVGRASARDYDAGMQQKVFLVTGMTCSHCVTAVRTEIGRIPDVERVDVDLGSGQVTVDARGGLDQEAVRAAVEEAGYELAG